MTKVTAPPKRWVDSDDSAQEGRLGELFRSVVDPKPLSPAALARIQARLRSRRALSPLNRRMREVLMACVMLLAGSSFAIAGWGAHDWWQERAHARQVPSAAIAAPSASGRKQRAPGALPRPRLSPAPSENPPSPALPAPSASIAEAPNSAAGAATLARPASSSAELSTLAAESAALEGVLFKLRRERDAAGALALLDASQALFARSTLALEAKVARVDALLMLGDGDGALAILDRLPLAQVGRGGEMRVLRAELRAKSDCARALSDFDLLVTQALSSPLAERALYGRAACELQVGDGNHARLDFERYLQRFPAGRFAAAAQRELERGDGKASARP